MKDSKSQALRWLRQAEYDLKEAEKCLTDESFSYACFFAEQAAQKSLKGYLIGKGWRFVNIHAVGELLKEAAKLEREKFEELVVLGQRLDKYYLASRYPDALPDPAIPAESYGPDEGRETVEIARKIFSVAKI